MRRFCETVESSYTRSQILILQLSGTRSLLGPTLGLAGLQRLNREYMHVRRVRRWGYEVNNYNGHDGWALWKRRAR